MMSGSYEWLSVELSVPAGQVDAAEAALFDAGALSVTLLDAQDHPLHEPAPGELPLWPQVVVQALFDASTRPLELSEALHASGVLGPAADLRFGSLPERDWQRAWMDQYRPMRFGRGLWICPSHVEPEPDWPLVVRLDPGLAFGSGTHPTTALCLAWIDAVDLRGRSVIDYGCGSGVLAIAAALKGAAAVIAVDHDPQALTATLDNASRNRVAERISALTPREFRDLPRSRRHAGLVIANILAQPLRELAPLLSDCVEAGGHLVLSGILPEQAADVAAAYRELDPDPDSETLDGWVRLAFRKPDPSAPR